MKSKLAVAALIALASQAALAEDAYWSNVANGFDKMIYAQKDHAAYWENVRAGFDNLFHHTPYYGPTAATVALGQADPAEALIHAMVRGENAPALAQQPAPYFDNVAASFGRMIEHTPHAGPTAVTVARGEPDAAEAMIHANLRGETHGAFVKKNELCCDSIAASFERMLDHTPYTGDTGVTVARTLDHRVDRLIFTLRQEQLRSMRLDATQNGSIGK